jgi:hypothetical protein
MLSGPPVGNRVKLFSFAGLGRRGPASFAARRMLADQVR